MATKQQKDQEKEDELDPKYRLPVIRPPFLFDEKRRKMSSDVEDHLNREREKLWAQVKRAEAQLPMNDIPQRRRALDRIYADLVATNALNGVVARENIRHLF